MSRLVSVLGALAMVVPGAAAATFNFDAVAPATGVPFSTTADGITAAFLSPTSSNFEIVSSAYSTLTGQVLKSDDPQQDTLEIAFSQSLYSASLRFALSPDLPGAPVGYIPPITLEAYLGGALVGSTTAVGTLQGAPYFSAEGVLAFSGSAFDTVRLGTGAFDFAIDEIIVAQVPEPNSIQLVVGALVLIGVFAPIRERLSRK